MTIPLDRLYDYLHNKSNHDIIIYRWLPHGSKKLEDLAPLRKEPNWTSNWFKLCITPKAVMHDQEPLQYDLWSRSDFVDRWLDHTKNHDPVYRLPDRIDFQVGLGLLGCHGASINVYDRWLLVHSEKNSKQVEIYQHNGFEPVYYWSHALIAQDWFRYAQHDSDLQSKSLNFKYDFLIYNRAWSGTREYRLTFADMLLTAGLEKSCLMSFATVDQDIHYTNHQFKNSDLWIARQDIEQHLPCNNSPSCASADYVSDDYCQSGIEIVLETLFDDQRHHLTEKTLRPIACGQPFMLASSPGSLKYLQSYGFKTFQGLIDETYDSIQSPRDRLAAIIVEMQRISLLPVDDKKQLFKKLRKIASDNKKRFFSLAFTNLVLQEFENNLDSAVCSLKQNHCNGKIWSKSKLLPHNGTPEQLKAIDDWLEANKTATQPSKTSR